MKYCTHCGKELFDEAVMCPGCGCPTTEEKQLPSSKPVKKIHHKQILIIVIAAVVLIGVVLGVLGIINNGRKNAIYEALEGESYSYTDYDSYKLTSLSFEANKKCEKYQFWSLIDSEFDFTYDYSVKISGGKVYVTVADVTYEAVIGSNDKTVVALIDEETGDRYD